MSTKAKATELKNGTKVRHVDGSIQGSGVTKWLCIRDCYRVQWSDGTYSTVPRSELIVEGEALLVASAISRCPSCGTVAVVAPCPTCGGITRALTASETRAYVTMGHAAFAK